MIPRPRARRSLAVTLAVGTLFALTACGNAAESGIEKLIEEQGGGNVDLDLNGDNGGFSIQTEDGSMTVDENGNFVVTDENGETVTGSADGDGGVNIESEDGSFSSRSTTELPEEWPSDVPQPLGLAIANATVIGSDTEQAITVSGAPESPDFVDSYGAALESAGFEQDSTFESGDMVQRNFTNDAWAVGLTETGGLVTLSVFSNS